MEMKIVSFYCDEPGSDYYERSAKVFKAAFDKLGRECHIEKMEYPGSWLAACRMKPKFLLDHLTEPILWIDIDLDIHKNPIFEGDFDLAVVKSINDLKWLAGFIGLKPCPAVFKFLQDWHESAMLPSNSWRGDHSIMVKSLRKFQEDLNLLVLPRKYCRVDGIQEDCFISHTASKTKKGKSNAFKTTD